MKRFTLSLLAFAIVGLGTVNASFPVEKSNNTDTETTTTATNSSEAMDAAVISAQKQFGESIEKIEKIENTDKFREEDWILLGLWFFLGGLAAHRWYAGKPWGWNVLYILTFGGCGIWAIVDLINIIKQDF